MLKWKQLGVFIGLHLMFFLGESDDDVDDDYVNLPSKMLFVCEEYH